MKSKIYILLFFSAFLLLSSFRVDQKLDFKTQINEVSENTINIIVTITSGKPDFTYSIWKGEPWENGTEIETSGKTTVTNYTFRDLEAKPYFVVVSDASGLQRIKQIKISE